MRYNKHITLLVLCIEIYEFVVFASSYFPISIRKFDIIMYQFYLCHTIETQFIGVDKYYYYRFWIQNQRFYVAFNTLLRDMISKMSATFYIHYLGADQP